MPDGTEGQNIDFTVNRDDLYREESVTDLKVASIRRMVPIKSDGSEDPSRSQVFFGSTQLMTPEGPLPIQSQLSATTLEEAMDEFPSAMRKALDQTIDRLKKMQQQGGGGVGGGDAGQSRIYTPYE
ncbi:MAG: cytoplasmic protein [Desulfobacterales bacterium]|nr:cytoplasmic protein [Desulfobacterales bacterium]MBS3756547.1 cytoplasmic protein [Desulfobacterales bacterium]